MMKVLTLQKNHLTITSIIQDGGLSSKGFTLTPMLLSELILGSYSKGLQAYYSYRY